MEKNAMLVPLLASVGVGAATYYTMTKNNQSLGQTMQQMVPLVSQMGGSSRNSGSSDKQTLGPYGMS
ncbi:hypothetical protein [Virgibacillus necropolis]|uniref:Uncharacterized protein n=1 Tax=Virgibacillus necropolis TaxID=163877 RepID=A0A221MBB7_9BACI|nr:hypothetical protein [Virgibacillus necropolis]ASN04935.1 hypothetical protein CFK40_07885 [Virgibacillus necropolis]